MLPLKSFKVLQIPFLLLEKGYKCLLLGFCFWRFGSKYSENKVADVIKFSISVKSKKQGKKYEAARSAEKNLLMFMVLLIA